MYVEHQSSTLQGDTKSTQSGGLDEGENGGDDWREGGNGGDDAMREGGIGGDDVTREGGNGGDDMGGENSGDDVGKSGVIVYQNQQSREFENLFFSKSIFPPSHSCFLPLPLFFHLHHHHHWPLG